jgi:hypothetical protein
MRRKSLRRGLALAVLMTAVAVGAVSAGASRNVTWPTAAQEIAKAGQFNLPFCGTQQITLAVLDGFGINAWSQESYTAARAEAAKCSNVKVITAAGGGDLQKSISDITSAVAQGAKAIVVIPDFGQAQLAANGHSCLNNKNAIALSTISSRNWLGRVAVRKAIAAAEGLPNNEPSIYNLTFFEDTLGGKALQCNPKAAADFYPSNQLTVGQIRQYGKP